MLSILNPLALELAGESALALGRSGRRLRRALDALRQYQRDTAAGHIPSNNEKRYIRLVEESAEAFWYYIIQREAMGLLDAEYIGRAYGVPREVWAKMGARRS